MHLPHSIVSAICLQFCLTDTCQVHASWSTVSDIYRQRIQQSPIYAVLQDMGPRLLKEASIKNSCSIYEVKQIIGERRQRNMSYRSYLDNIIRLSE